MSRYAEYGPLDEPPGREPGDERFVGVNNRLDPDKLGPGVLSDAQNCRLREGKAVTRPGVIKPGWLNVTNGTDATVRRADKLYGVGEFKDPNGTEWTFIAADGGIYRHKPSNARFAMTLPGSVKVLTDCTFTQAFNKMYCWRGRHLAPLVLKALDTGFEDLLPRWNAAPTYAVNTEVAYGPFQATATVTSAGNLVTVTCTQEHGYITGADITVQGAVQVEYNGRWGPITVLDANTFTFAFPGSATTPATGTIKVSNMANYFKALGTLVTLTSLTHVTVTATATKVGHGFSLGQTVTIAGATPAGYNGTFLITAAAANTFTYTLAADPGVDATGAAITARNALVLAGQSPDTNPEAWQQLYTILPNADDALYTNNRLLVPTAYTPGLAGYDSTSVYTKKDFIVATDIQDDLHFDFSNEFRINQGSDDEIVQLLKYNQDTVIVFKGKSWGILSGVALDLANLALDMRGDAYGACARGAAMAGKNVVLPVSKRGICSLAQNELGQVRSTDIPFSNDVAAWVNRIQWSQASRLRIAYWDDRLYCAVPLRPEDSRDVIQTGHYDSEEVWVVPTVIGRTYSWVKGPTVNYIDINNAGNVFTSNVTFVATSSVVALVLIGGGGVAVTGQLLEVLADGRQVNNAIMVYDFRLQRMSQDPIGYDFQSGQWCSLDTGTALTVKEFFKATVAGVERLFFIAEDGWVNMLEESDAGDHREDGSLTGGLSWNAIALEALTRGYKTGSEENKKFKRLRYVAGVCNAKFSVEKQTAAAKSAQPVLTDKTFSRTKYLKPAGKADYADGNGNGDWATPGRGDYSVVLGTGQVQGVGAEQFQEITDSVGLQTTEGRYVQIRFTNSQGKFQLKSVIPETIDGQKRQGIQI